MVGTICILYVSILARPRRTGAPRRHQCCSKSAKFQSSPVREGRALHGASGGLRRGGVFQSSPVREGRALRATRRCRLHRPGFNPRPSAKDGRSPSPRSACLWCCVSILARPRRTGALKVAAERLAKVLVSILARPRRTGAPEDERFQHLFPSFNPRPSAKDGRSSNLISRRFHMWFQSSPVREGRALVSILVSPFMAICFNPRPSAKDGRSRCTRTSPRPRKFQSSPVREGRALCRLVRINKLLPCFNPRPSAKDGRSPLQGRPVAGQFVSILARPRRTGAPQA